MGHEIPDERYLIVEVSARAWPKDFGYKPPAAIVVSAPDRKNAIEGPSQLDDHRFHIGQIRYGRLRLK